MVGMSYDVEVYLPEPVAQDDILTAIRAGGKLDAGHVTDNQIEVVTAGRRLHRYTIDGPQTMELEDLPPELAGRLLSASALYAIHAPAQSATDAVRFAKRLAREHRGGYHDPQTNQAWASPGLRRIAPPQSGMRLDLIKFEWSLRTRDLAEVAEAYLGEAVQILPEALPRRWGDFEPFQYTSGPHHFKDFVSLVERSRVSVSFTANLPSVGGSVDGAQSYAKFGRLTTTMIRDSLRAPGWRNAAELLFIKIAQTTPVIYASAEVENDWIWRQGKSWSDSQTTGQPACMDARGWRGLHPAPVWLAWYGHEYTKLLVELLPRDNKVQNFAGCLLYRASELPLDATELDNNPIPERLRYVRTDGRPAGTSFTGYPFEVAAEIPAELST